MGKHQDTELFDCLQKSMVCVSYSYLALEVYCNETISEHETKPVTRQVKNRDGKKIKVTKPAKDWERECSTEEKLGVVLPQLLDIDSPKGQPVWEDLKVLQRARNDIVHPKAVMTNPRIRNETEIPRASVFLSFLRENSRQYPRIAVHMILYFATATRVPGWLYQPLNELGIRAPDTTDAKNPSVP